MRTPSAPDGAVALPTEREPSHELLETNHLLRRLIQTQRTDIKQLCLTDHEPAQMVMENFPVPGSKRLIVRRTGNGGTYAPGTTAANATLLADANDSRLAGQICVVGAAAVTLYLCELGPVQQGEAQGFPQINLLASGGSWDFRLSGVVWCGHVVAVAAGATTVTVAEV
jgi:hypothetical protein